MDAATGGRLRDCVSLDPASSINMAEVDGDITPEAAQFLRGHYLGERPTSICISKNASFDST